MKPLNKKIVYHTPCHLKGVGSRFTIEVLKMIPGLEVVVLDSECCGLAGTYGFKGKLRSLYEDRDDLFSKIRRSNADYAITDCETCSGN